MTKKIKKPIDINELMDEYKPSNHLFTEDTDRFNLLSNIIFGKLEEWQRRVILMYAEYGSMRKVAKLLNVSPSLVNITIQSIRKEILYYYNKKKHD